MRPNKQTSAKETQTDMVIPGAIEDAPVGSEVLDANHIQRLVVKDSEI